MFYLTKEYSDNETYLGDKQNFLFTFTSSLFYPDFTHISFIVSDLLPISRLVSTAAINFYQG